MISDPVKKKKFYKDAAVNFPAVFMMKVLLAELKITDIHLQRFWMRVDKNGPVLNPDLGNCWSWTGGCRGESYSRYGILKVDGRHVAVHRLSLILHTGMIDRHPLYALHKCDNPRCVNPDHLFWGTLQDNVDDMFRKGRNKHQSGDDHPSRRHNNSYVLKGSAHHRAKISEDDVRFIRKSKREGVATIELMKMFGLTRTSIDTIARGESWKHVEM